MFEQPANAPGRAGAIDAGQFLLVRRGIAFGGRSAFDGTLPGPPSMSTSRLAVGAACAALALPCAGQSPDPFSPHERWTAAEASSAPWLPSSLEFALDGELLLEPQNLLIKGPPPSLPIHKCLKPTKNLS